MNRICGVFLIFSPLLTVAFRLLGNDWLTDDGNFFDRNGSLAVDVNFLLAMKHVNERREDILPVLGTMKNCAHNFSMPGFLDDGGSAAKLLGILLDYETDFDAIVGVGTSSVAKHAATLSTVFNRPIISHWATSPELSDKTQFPLFARTANSDAVVAKKVILLAKQFGLSKIAMLYDENQVSYKQVFEETCVEQGMVLTSFSLPNSPDVTLLHRALQSIVSLQLNVVFIHGYEHRIRFEYADAFAQFNLLSPDKMVILDDFDKATAPEYLLPGLNLTKLLAGSFRVVSESSNTFYFDRFVQMWESGHFSSPESLSFLNHLLPPYGSNTDLSPTNLHVKDTALDMQVDSDFFLHFTASNAFIVWGMAYDAVVTMALASCASNGTTDGQTLFQAILNVSFQGMSGFVSFDEHGDRHSHNFVFKVHNTNSFGLTQTVGVFNESSQDFALSQELNFRAGVNVYPVDITPPPVDLQQLPSGLKTLVCVLVALLNLTCFVCLMWLLKNFSHKVVLAAQREFLLLFLVGSVLMSWSILPLVVDDNTLDGFMLGISANTACMLVPFLYSVGFMFSMWILIAKTIRVYLLFHQRTLKRNSRKVGPKRLTVMVMGFVLLDLGLLGLWALIDPLLFFRNVLIADANGFPISSVGICSPSTNTGLGFASGIFIVHIFTLVFLAVFIQRIRHLPEEFQESRHLMLLFSSLFQLYILCLGVYIAVSANVIGRFIVSLVFIAATVLIQLGFLFVPKMNQVRANKLFREWLFANSDKAEVDFEEAIANTHIQAKFQAYAERNLFVESLFFYLDVDEFEKSNPLPAHNLSQARELFDTYIKPGAIFQINISERLREEVEANLESFVGGHKSGKNAMIAGNEETALSFARIFRPAKSEIVNLLNMGGWKAFVESGGMYGEKITSKLAALSSNVQPYNLGHSLSVDSFTKQQSSQL